MALLREKGARWRPPPGGPARSRTDEPVLPQRRETASVPVERPEEEKRDDASPTDEKTDRPELDPLLATMAVEMAATLGVSGEVACKVVWLLGRRDLAAEAILEGYGASLSTEAIRLTWPRLRALDEETDREIESLLAAEPLRTYRRLRAEGVIAGTALDLPPETPAESFQDPEAD